jgi:hypothetical protein
MTTLTRPVTPITTRAQRQHVLAVLQEKYAETTRRRDAALEARDQFRMDGQTVDAMTVGHEIDGIDCELIDLGREIAAQESILDREAEAAAIDSERQRLADAETVLTRLDADVPKAVETAERTSTTESVDRAVHAWRSAAALRSLLYEKTGAARFRPESQKRSIRLLLGEALSRRSTLLHRGPYAPKLQTDTSAWAHLKLEQIADVDASVQVLVR